MQFVVHTIFFAESLENHRSMPIIPLESCFFFLQFETAYQKIQTKASDNTSSGMRLLHGCATIFSADFFLSRWFFSRMINRVIPETWRVLFLSSLNNFRKSNLSRQTRDRILMATKSDQFSSMCICLSRQDIKGVKIWRVLFYVSIETDCY